MIVYHTGFQEIREPDLHYGRKNADFGQGFYLTSNLEFAQRWTKERKNENAVLNTYELDLSGLSVHRFERDTAWFLYLSDNRAGKPDTLPADVVIGPIANDTLYDTLGMVTSRFLTKEEALQLLTIGPEFEQIALKTEKAKEHLQWKTSRIIGREEIRKFRDIMEKEQEKYLTVFAKTMESFL